MGCAMQDIIETTPPCAADADEKTNTSDMTIKQQTQQHNSQQLKEQHSALVRLLESAPIAKNQTSSTTKSLTNSNNNNLSSNIVNIPRTSPIVVVQQQQQQQQQHQQHHQHDQQHQYHQQQKTILYRKRLKCDNKRNNDLVNDGNSYYDDSKCPRTTLENESKIPPTLKTPADDSTSDKNLNLNTCPWKKIRYAREWKQKELLENKKQKNCDNSKKKLKKNDEDNYDENDDIDMNDDDHHHHHRIVDNDNVIDNNNKARLSSLSSDAASFNTSIYRRDSSDSNCSVISNSNLSQCTCYSNGYDSECDENDDDDENDLDHHNNDSSKNINCCNSEKNLPTDVADLCQKFNENLSNGENNNGFFRRSIQQKIQYRPCTKNQQCSILRINRNRCQYCRLKKCIAVGMSRDAVRFGRVPKREKARILAAMQQSTQNRGQQRALATELDDQPRLLAAVLRAHMETCEFTKEKVTAMRQRARECPSYSMPTLLACPLNPAPELQSEQEFSQRFAHVIRGVIDFAGMIPGFQLLTQDDKFTLLKAGLFDALFVRLICMFDSSINSIICLNGQVMRRDAIQNGANARFLVDSTFNFAERMNSMNLTDTEIGLFCAIVLITPDRPGLRNIELIEKMYSRLKACLQSVIAQNRPDQPEFLTELLKTLPDLRTLSTLHTEKLVVFRTEHKELLRQQMWTIDDDQPSKSPGSSTWDNNTMEDIAKSPLGSVSSTESGDLEYSQSSLASSAPLLAATLSGTCPLRHRANSGSSAEDIDIVGTHAHLTQNGLTITPVARSHHSHSLLNSRYRKLDSPTDSGIESGNEKAESTKTASSGGSSSCSSPRSTVDDVLDEQHNHHHHHSHHHAQNGNNSLAAKRQIVEDMPVLKRVLQAPPLYDTNSLMDEAYKPHKKFRALRHRDFETAEADAHVQHTTSSTTPAMNSSSSSMTTSSTQQQSQLHMHLTRNSNNNNNNNHSSLSSTHSVLAKSLMEEPRMTPEQMKRTDIIQNYIMREQPVNGLLVCAASSPTSSTSSSSSLSSSSSSSSSSANLNCSSSSTTTVTLSSPPPPPPHAMRWQGHSVITTTLRNQSVSPINNNVLSSNYFQSPHSTSISSPRASPSSVQSPRLLELQVDIADSQQPLNLSKKSPTPPPMQHQHHVHQHQQQQQQQLSQPKTTTIQRSYPVAADITVTTATTNSQNGATAPQVHKILLEA